MTAVSVHACAYIPNYVMLRSGGSFGIGYGPIVTATKPMTIDEIKKSKIANTWRDDFCIFTTTVNDW